MTTPDLAERDQVVLSVVPDGSSEGRPIKTWTRYSFNSNFLTPTDGWEFEIGGKTIDKSLFEVLVPGVKIQLSVNGHVQATGRVDDLEVSADRSQGTVLRVTGRDMMGQVVDGNADPKLQFTRDMTLTQILVKVLVDQFGFGGVLQNPAADRDVKTGQQRGDKRTKKGKPIKSLQAHQVRPYANESAFAFLARIVTRFGLWLWTTADGASVIVDIPDFEQQPLYTLRRRTDDQAIHNNVLSGGVRLSMADQPTHIVCDGFGGGGEFGHSRLRCFISNPVFSANNGPILDAYPDIVHIETDFTITSPPPIDIPHARCIYLHDEESRTADELENFARRQLALRMHRSLVAHYEVAGHTQNGVPWEVDTIVNVQDDLGGLHEPMWVLSRTFTKDRHAGTRTHLDLVRKGSLEF